MPAQPKDDLPVLIARLRAAGGKVCTNVVDGHNVTAPDGKVRQFSSTRVAWKGQDTPNRDQLRAHLRQLLGDEA